MGVQHLASCFFFFFVVEIPRGIYPLYLSQLHESVPVYDYLTSIIKLRFNIN